MKRYFAVIFVLLSSILLIAGCATTPGVQEEETVTEVTVEERPVVAPVTTSTAELISSIAASSVQVPEPVEEPAAELAAEPETPVEPVDVQEKTLEELYDETVWWPDNSNSLPVIMNYADDVDYWNAFVEMANDGASVDELEGFLHDWWEMYGWTPEFYAACHNYYFIKASVLLDSASSEEDIKEVYACFDRCFVSTLRGAMHYPDRLDLWCGFVHAANLIGDFSDAEQVCLLIFNRLFINGNNWYWTCNEPFYADDETERENEFVGIMHDYISTWLGDDDGLEYAFPVSEVLADTFPENAIALNDRAMCAVIKGELEDAAGYLERAYASNQEDLVVIGNLAYAYSDMENFDAASYYAKRMIQSGDAEYVDMGIRLLAEIKGKMSDE